MRLGKHGAACLPEVFLGETGSDEPVAPMPASSGA
jgi:hypothetical protein